jgi:uncharacterized protein (DUF58 family)
MAERDRERIYLIPRWAGLVLGAVVLAVFALGYVSPATRGLTQVLGITLMVASVVVLIQSNENLRGLDIVGCRSLPASAGEDIVLELTLRNRSRSERVGIWVGEGISWRRFWKSNRGPRVWVPLIAAEGTRIIRLPIPTSKRGRFPVPTLWISSVLPYGLGFAWKVVASCGTYFVYPCPRGAPLNDEVAGGRFFGVKVSQGNADVTGHRKFESGDEVALRWRDTDSLADDETRLEQLSFWISECVRESRGFTLDLGSSDGHLHHRNVVACYEALAVFRGSKGEDFNGDSK